MYPTSDRTIIPYLFFENLELAIPWLCRTFGFEERFRLDLPSGAIAHAEVQLEDGVIMLGNVGARNSQSPTTTRSSTYVFVNNVDDHHEHTLSAGAEIIQGPADQPFGDRTYLALDLEGHEWYFAQHMRDVSIDELRNALNPRG